MSLQGWQIADAASASALPAVTVPAGGYAVIAAKSAVLPGAVLVARLTGSIGRGINNGGDLIQLIAPGGAVVDELSFGDDTSVFDPAPPVPPKGRTLAIVDPAADPDGANWRISSRPTPGEPNEFPAQAAGTAGATPDAAQVQAGTVPVKENGSTNVAPYLILGTAIAVSGVTLGLKRYRRP